MFQAPKTIPGLAQEPDRALIRALTTVAADIARLSLPEFRATELVSADYAAELGQLVLAVPPATSMRVLLPTGTAQNITRKVRVMVLSTAAGGSVTMAVAGGAQTINDSLNLGLPTVGVSEFQSMGVKGWGAVSGGGGGAVSDGIYGSITVSGGGTIWQITDGVYGDVTVSGGGTTWTVAGGGLTQDQILNRIAFRA